MPWSMFSNIGRSTAIFTTQSQALKQTQAHQYDRGGYADTRIGRQQAHNKSGQAHNHNRHKESIFTSYQIAQPAKYQGTERAHRKSGSKCHQCKDEGGSFIYA